MPSVLLARPSFGQPVGTGTYAAASGTGPASGALQFICFPTSYLPDEDFRWYTWFGYESRVRESVYGPDGQLERLAIDFRYYRGQSANDGIASVNGSLRYQSTIPVPGPRLVNLSTRLEVGSGDRVAIAGFVIQGDRDKPIVVRALGPTLGSFGVSNPLSRPKLRILNADGVEVTRGRTRAEGSDLGLYVRSLSPPDEQEPACATLLSTRAFTAIVESADGSSGVALLEVYDTDVGTTSRPVNLSTRGIVGRGDAAMIAGFVVGGPTPKRLLIRALGPTLAGFGVSGALADPVIELRNSAGGIVATNDNWRASQQAEIAATPFAPANDAEPAIVATLAPGSYTAIVRGVGDTTGVGLVEVYELDAP